MTIAPPVHRPTSLPRLPGSVLLRNVSWKSYAALRREIGDDAVHLTYDEGFLEIEVPSERHEQLKSAVRMLVEDALKSARIRFEPFASTTWESSSRLKGIEADECYYVQNAEAIRGRRPVDLTTSPPPDLAIEVEVSTSAIDKLSIYKAIGIPEVWRVSEDGGVRVLMRQPDGSYQEVERSAAVLGFTGAEISGFLNQLEPQGKWSFADMIESFQSFLDARKA